MYPTLSSKHSRADLPNRSLTFLILPMENQLHAFRFTFYGTTRRDLAPTDMLIYFGDEADDFYLGIAMQVD